MIDFNNKNNNLLHNIIGGIFLLLLVAVWFYAIIIPFVSARKVEYLAKDPKNIRDDGCLMYASKSDKHGSLMFYLNQKGPYTLRQISINPEQSDRQLGKLIRESGLSYYDFVGVHSKECIRVRYIHNKTLWASGDDIYDFY